MTLLTPSPAVSGPGQQEEDPSAKNLARQLRELQLEPARLAGLEKELEQRDYRGAEKILVEEAERDPRSKRAAGLLELAGGIFFLDGQYLNAAIAWKRADAITPINDRSRFTLAMAYIRLDKREWARPELESLNARKPHNALYLYWLGRLDYDGRNYSSAMSRFERVIELDPRMARAYDSLGLCYDYLGRFEDAVASFERSIELNRQQARPSPWPHIDFALSLIALNRLPEAESNLRQALGYGPQLAQAHYQLGRVLEMQGRYQEALDSLKTATTLAPGYADPHYLLGRIYHRLGFEPLSRTEISRFQELTRTAETQSAGAPKS
jgi:tetratricopeptide (TPR) repeat protein